MVFKEGIDQGYREDPNWWFQGPEAFRMADPSDDYPVEYFPLAEPPRIKEFCDIVTAKFTELTKRKLNRIVEFGSGGGWYLKEFQARNISVYGYEGSAAGVAHCLQRGVSFHNIAIQDLRTPLDRKFRKADIALLTEVAEHVEPPFAGTLIYNVTRHSDLVWFSAEGPGSNSPHLHHPNEQPLEYWKAIFEFFNFSCHMLSDEIMKVTENRGRCVFFNKHRYQL